MHAMDTQEEINAQNKAPGQSNPLQRLEYLLKQTDNRVCADCSSPDPKWAFEVADPENLTNLLTSTNKNERSVNLGVFICIKCSGVHRSLGVHISKVLSVKLDEWTDEHIACLIDGGGNAAVNKRYEAFIPEHVKKSKPDSSSEERSDFIRRKYEQQQFLNSNLQIVSAPTITLSQVLQGNASGNKLSEKQHAGIRHGLGHAFSWRRKDSDLKATNKTIGMVEFVGLIKVNIIRGTNLAVRDIMMSSDPYVILTLGHQSVKTRVIKSSLNPVWNEMLMLSIPEPTPPLKLQVYDRDTFKSDDRMGEAEIDIQPLISAAKAWENSTLSESMQIGKWLANDDNALVKDSVISFVDGIVKQEITLRLQNVERGELEIELECVPLSQ